MRKTLMILGLAFIGLCGLTAVRAAEPEPKLPPGPILDRHELMKGIGKNAKVIGDAMKSGNFAPVGEAAEKIQTAAAKITALFPPGSTHANSRAKPEIWTDWPKFETGTKQLETSAGALASAAKSGGNIPTAAQTMFDSCKSCHDQFRVPEKKKQ
jgi:cytochrome c556